MKVYYHSALNKTVLTPGSVLRTVPCKAVLKLHKEKTESPCELVYNGTIINPDTTEIECNEEAELVIRQDGERYVYSIRPSVQLLTTKMHEPMSSFRMSIETWSSMKLIVYSWEPSNCMLLIKALRSMTSLKCLDK